MLILVEPMEHTGRPRSAGTDVSDVRGRLNAKFAYIKDALEFEMSLWQFVRIVLVKSVEYQQKLAYGEFAYFLGNVFKTSFCRKPKKLPVFPKRFNSQTIGKLRQCFKDSLQLRIFSQKETEYH